MAISLLNNEIFSQNVVEAFVGALAPLRIFSTDFQNDAKSKGDTVTVPYVAEQAAATDFGTAYTAQSVTATGLPVVLTAHKFVSAELTDTEVANSSSIKMQLFARKKGFALAKAVFQDILGLALTTNFGAAAFTGTHTSFDADDVVDIAEVCDAAHMPEFGRGMALKSAYYNNLIKDNTVQSSSAFGSSGPVQQGVISNLAGFDMYKSNLIPANSINVVGFAAVAEAIAIAMRYLMPHPGHNYSRAESMVDPDTGIVIGIREWYEPSEGKLHTVFESLYGYRVGVAAGMKLIVSA